MNNGVSGELWQISCFNDLGSRFGIGENVSSTFLSALRC